MPKRSTVAKADDRALSASECAQRTGVTIKALRVYERQGLIKPSRSASGWRCYGHAELVRLNAIAALKVLGLSLAQIRAVLDAVPIELPRILRMQLEAWQSRKEQATNAIVLVQAALARVETHQAVSIDNLCELARRIEMTESIQWSREIINEAFTPEEEREWLNYAATLSKGEMQEGRQQFQNWQALLSEFRQAMDSGADPASAEVQALIERTNAFLRDSGAREKSLRRLEWNPNIARKIHAIGSQMMVRSVVEGGADTERKLAEYLAAARAASTWGRAFAVILEEAKKLQAANESAASTATQELLKRFVRVCTEHRLGEPVVIARWLAEFGHMSLVSKPISPEPEVKNAWTLLATAASGAASTQ